MSAQATSSAAPSARGPLGVRPVKFLLVDDLDENLLAIEALLRREGLELLKAKSGTEALELLLVHEISLALVDVQMPGMDGFELAELMRGSPRTAQVPIIFVTAGHRDQHRVFRGYEAGAVDFLYKPIEPHILRSKADVFFDLALQKERLAAKVDLLRASEEFRRRMLEGSHDSIQILELSGVVLSMSGVPTAHPCPHDGSDAVGHNWLEFWTEEHRPAAEKSLAEARTGGVGRFVGLCAPQRRTARWWDVVLSPVRGRDGEVERILAISRDDTERRRAEQERELFTAVLGHDLRNPISSVLLCAEGLRRKTDDERVRGAAERIISTSTRMATLVEELLDFARSRVGGGIPVVPQRFDLAQLAKRVASEYQLTAPGRTIDLRVEGATEGEWDENRLYQVLNNLVGNAVRHGSADTPIELRLDGTGQDEVQLAVSNAGHIPRELQPKIFDPFRSSADPQRRAEGLGLGLYIVQQVVVAHRGRIELRSAPETGTTFVVSLPREAARSGAPS